MCIRDRVKEGKSRNRGVLLLLIVSGLFVLYLIIFSFIPAIMLKLVKIDFVVPFEVNQGEQIHCVLIKSETLLEAPVGGDVYKRQQ